MNDNDDESEELLLIASLKSDVFFQNYCVALNNPRGNNHVYINITKYHI